MFYTGESLCWYLKQDKLDIAFLDIELATMTGIEIGHYIRERKDDNETQIVFISGMSSYAMELFKIRPLDFLVKPLNYQYVEKAILTAVKLRRLDHSYFEFTEQRSTVRIPISSILYFESTGKRCV
ncbi:MAG: response regulator [Candidatus Fimivivens sp.]|nr:response regulator [Candidatus Fimivivens sp.]